MKNLIRRWILRLVLAVPFLARRRRARLLADAAQWSVFDIARELGVPAALVRAWTSATAHRPPNLHALPAPSSVQGWERRWRAGDVRAWGQQTARLDHNLFPRRARPNGRPSARRPPPPLP